MVYLSYILVILSGLLISVAFFFPKFFILGLIGLVPFLFAIKRDKPAQGFIKGLLLGIIISIMTASWLYYPLFEIAGLPLTLTILLMVIVYLILSFFYGLFTWVYLYIKGSKKFSPFCFAVCWTGIEYLRFRIVSAFPFGFMAYTQTDFYPLIQFAEVGGIFLISFILFLVNSYFYQLLSNKKLRFLVSLIIIFAVIMTYGTIRINKFENNEYEMLDVGVIQTILSPEAKRNPANIEVNMNSLVDKSASLSGVELIVWPESALKFDFIRNEYYRKKFDNKIKNINKYLQVGSIAVREDDMNLYNSAFLISPDGNIKDRYNKMRLVPFGEYVPFSKLVKMISGYSMNHETPGKKAVIFETDFASWRTVICSEVLYPSMVKKGIEKSNFIINSSNENWYKKGNLQQQMWSAAVYRSVENRRALVKSGNLAFGGAIGETGKPITKIYSREKEVIKNKIPLNKSIGKTFYQKYGDFVGYISLFLTLLLVIIKTVLNRKYKNIK